MVTKDAGIAASSNGYHKTDKYVDNSVVSWNPGSSDTSSFTGGGGSHSIDSMVTIAGNALKNVFSSLSSTAKNVATSAMDYTKGVFASPGVASSSGWSGSARSSGGTTLDYMDAPIAQHYGMDTATAYQEALSNNAVQRHTQDLIAAGLNPVLAINGSGASVFSGDTLSTGSAGGMSYGNSSARGLSNNVKNGISNAVGGAVGLIAAASGVKNAGALASSAKSLTSGLVRIFG